MKIIRFIGVFVLATVFIALAVVLYQKQKLQYTFRSFELPAPATTIFIPDVDRLIRRMATVEDLHLVDRNPVLMNGVNAVLKLSKTNFNADFGKSCLVSFTENDFNLVFKNQDLSPNQIHLTLTQIFQVSAEIQDAGLKVGDMTYYIQQYGAFTVIGTTICLPNEHVLPDPTTNADYVVFLGDANPKRYILAYDQIFTVWEESAEEISGNTIRHDQFLKKVPLSFEALNFYGSERFEQDKYVFFNDPVDDGYSWIDRGVMIIKKGSFEIMIAPQNDQRDLKLMLEEQTLGSQNDSILPQTIVVKNFEIMPFKSQFNWTSAIPSLTDTLTHYTEFENFNVLSNSLAAMQWYLSEIQIGNMADQNELFMTHYLRSVPQQAHLLQFVFDGNLLKSESAAWTGKTRQVRTNTVAMLNESNNEGSGSPRSFDLPFEPTYILPITSGEAGKILVASDLKLALFMEDGTLGWQAELGSKLILAPELIDLNGDGVFEIATYSLNEFNVFGADGKPIPNLSIKTPQPLKGGMSVTYETANDYRFFLVFGSQVMCYTTSGQPANGWQFGGLTAPLTGAASHAKINGIDLLSFKDINSKIYLLTRRGESRFGTILISKLPNESEFVLGKSEELVYKLGYSNQNIYTRFLKDGYTDSLKLDIPVNAVSAKWIQSEIPLLIIEEPNRILLFNSAGYLEGEVLKPAAAPTYIRAENTTALHYVFYNNANNSLYLLNRDGRILSSGLSSNPLVYGISTNHFYTYSELKLYEHKLK